MIYNTVQNQGNSGQSKKFATGIIRVSSDKKSFSRTNSSMSEERNFVQVEQDFGFVPSFIFVLYRSQPDVYIKTVYKKGGLGTEGDYDIDMNGAVGYVLKGNAYVTNRGFCLPFTNVISADAEWYAYE